MSEQKPDWYGRLEKGPLRKKRFTRNQMNYFGIGLASIIPACFVVSLIFFRDEIGNMVTTVPQYFQAIPSPKVIPTPPHMNPLKDPQLVKQLLQLHLKPENAFNIWGEPSSKLGARTDWEYWYYNWDTKQGYAFPPATSSSIPADLQGIREGNVGVQLIISFFKGDALRFDLYYKGADEQVHDFQVEKDSTRTDRLADPPKTQAQSPAPTKLR